MSTLFAMSQVALFGRELSPSPEDKNISTCESNTGSSNAESAETIGWPMPEPSSLPVTSQPARWRINSGDLEEMVLRAAAGLGLDRRNSSGSAATSTHAEGSSPPLPREDIVEEQEGAMGFPMSSTSRGSSPLYNKSHHATSDYQLDHTIDTTAPSSPCTPSLHMHSSLSAVSPTSSTSEEAAFQHQLLQEADARLHLAVPAVRSAMPAHGAPGSTTGRFGLKLLVSNSMAGTLIGKGGTRICEIKDECLADIKVTPNGRFYPGTHERVVLVVGEPGSVQMACDRIVTTIYTAADTSLDITQRVLIPDAASGLIIGHDGVRLGELRQQAGVASIQVSPRDMCTVAGERVVTLQGPMSAVIHGLTLIVDRMMEDTTASRYQNMSTIYRAVHLHLPPYAVPGMHDGSSPRHPHHPRMSPSYGAPSQHHGQQQQQQQQQQHQHQHDFHSPNGLRGGGGGGGGRDYGGNNSGNGGMPRWEYGYNGNGPREMPHGGNSGNGNGGSVEYAHRSLSMSAVHVQHGHSSPAHHRSKTASSAQHFGDRQLRGEVGDFSDSDTRARSLELEDRHLEYDGSGDIGLGRPSGRESGGYLHHSPRLSGPSSREFGDHMRQQQQQHGGEGSRCGIGGRGGGGNYNTGASSQQSEYLLLQAQHQRLRQQQMARPSSAEYSRESGNMLLQEARAAAAVVASQQRGMQQESGGAPMHRANSASMQLSAGGMGSPSHGGGDLRRCHTITGGGAPIGGDGSSLAGIFDGLNLNSPHALASPHSNPQQQGQGQGQAGSGGLGGIVHGELPVPDADVGIILGKCGATVRELQQLSGAKIMIARRNEFMPGTKHRLVTIAGPPLAVSMARFLIMRKIQTEKEKQ